MTSRSGLVRMVVAGAAIALSIVTLPAQSPTADNKKAADQTAQRQTRVKDANGRVHTRVKPITQAEREAAAARLKALMRATAVRSGVAVSGATAIGSVMAIPANQLQMGPNGQLIPDYSGATPNYANSPVPQFDFNGNYVAGTGMRKFMDTLPGLYIAGVSPTPAAGSQYIPVAIPDRATYTGSDYYEIELGEYSQKMHADLPPTRLRGYRQTNTTNTVVRGFHYLGPVIIAQKGRPVRIKFTNALPAGTAGDLFLPVDASIMGAGPGPNTPQDGTPADIVCAATPQSCYRQNRATLHLHGGVTPWISDGTTHQWITPGGDDTPYPKGVSVYNVPDMPNPGKPPATNAADPGRGVQTFYYTNDQSARLMFYHDHAMGITRLNVYAGEAAGYLLQDDVETDLVTRGVIPADQIPLVIQDKTFVDPVTIPVQDPTWNWGTNPLVNGRRAPKLGDLWWPHVYMPAQNPYDVSGLNAMGRWHYGPWFWPPAPIANPPVANPYYDPVNAPWQPPQIPATPNPSWGAEAFLDTPVINGMAYPTVTLDPKAYRFRILNAAHDRFWNLQLYVADGSVTTSDGRNNTEVKMVPATPDTGLPPNWPADAREGGLPDPTTVGPSFVQIGTEGGFLPMPVIVPNQPIAWNTDPTTFNFGNVSDHALLLGPAERADVIVDFSAFAGKTLILYNDAPAAFPALDARNDYYTGAPDRRDTGGVDTTRAGFGPNIRTIMQIKVNASGAAAAYDVARLMTEFAPDPAANPPRLGVFQRGQDPIIVGQSAYDQAYGRTFPSEWPYWGYARIQDFSMPIETYDGTRPVDPMPFQTKAIHDEMGATFDDYGRMSAKLGLEIPNANPVTANFVMQGYADPPTELVRLSATTVPIGTPAADGTQIWKITHNGVDTHPVHFHLFHVQLLNRVGWDGAIRPPHPTELGWKDTLRISPLEDTIVAVRPIAPLPSTLPPAWGGLPNSVRPLNPVLPLGSTLGFSGVDPLGNPLTITNEIANFGWEYVWHCHILSHEENDMMRSIVFAMPPTAPGAFTRTILGTSVRLNWTNTSNTATSFTVQRATDATFTTALATIPLGLVTTYTDTPGPGTYFYRVFATNTAGSTVPGYPQIGADSPFSATVGPVTLSLGRLEVTPSAIDFLPQRLNFFSAAQILTLSNTGNAPLTINGRTLVGADAAQFQQQATTCGTTLAGGASCTVSLRYRPTSLGPKSAALRIASTDVARPTLDVPLTGAGTQLVIAPASLTFANQAINTTSAFQTLTLTNFGTTRINGFVVSFAGANAGEFNRVNGFFGNCGTGLNAGATCSIRVTFRPTAGGARTAVLNLANTEPTNPRTVALTGTGLAPALTIAPASLTFASQPVNTTSAAQTVTVTNSGTSPMTITSISQTGINAAQFSSTTCASSLAAGASCTVSVTFTPTAVGTITATLNVNVAAPAVSGTVALSGVGASAPAPVLGLSPSGLNFGSQTINTPSLPQTVTLSNTGTGAMTINAIAVGGSTAQYPINNTCPMAPLTLAAGGSCTVDVTFNPPAAAVFNGSLNVTMGPAVPPVVTGGVTLTGTGVSAPTFSIAGGVGAAGGGATMALSGGATATGTADPATGLYSFPGLVNGIYTITPAKPGFTFAPASITVQVAGGNIGNVNFVATATVSTFSVSGSVGAAGVGATLTLAPGGLSAIAGAGGAFSIAGVANGGYTLTPSLAGFTFAPTSAPVTVNNADVTGVTFITTPPATFTVSGSLGTAGAAGTVTLTPGGLTATADATGAYAIAGVAPNAYTATPVKAGVVFAPLSANITVTNANLAGVNFTPTFSIAGSVGAAGGGATMTLTGGAAPVTQTANATTGNFTFTGIAPGNYTLTPTRPGTSFAPVSAAVTVSNANVTGLAFTASSTFTVSGSLGTGGAGGTVTLMPGGLTAIASATGAYTVTGVAPGTYTATPAKAGVIFAPTSSPVTVSTANVTGVNFTATFLISGSLGLPGAGATVALTGGRTTPADANGVFTFTGVANGTYAVTPAKAGYTFNPVSAQAVVNGANVTGLTFTATLVTYSISGSVGAVGGGATMTLTGGAAPVTVTANVTTGAYTFTGVAPGNYAVTPAKAGVAFAPLSTAVPVVAANVTGVNFTPTFSISGTVGAVGGAATMTLTGGAAPLTVTANATTGNYTFAGVAPGNYTVTPSRTGFSFTPPSAAVPVVGASVTGINFTAAAGADPAAVGAPVEAQGLGTRSVTVTTTTPGLLLVAFVGADGPAGANQQATTVSGGAGLTWTRARQQRAASGVAEIWTARAAAAGTFTITSTLQNAAFQQRLSVLAFANVSAVGANGGASGTATSAASTSITAQAAGSLVYAVGNDWSNIAARTFPATQSVVGTQFLAPGLVAVWAQRLNGLTAAAGAVTMNTSGPTSNAWNLAAIELRR